MLARPGTAGLLLAGGTGLVHRLPARAAGWFAAGLRDEVENRRLLPWLAVCYGAGILLAFAADGPSIWPALAVGIALAAASFRARSRLAGQIVLAALAAVFLGFAASLARTAQVEAPVLARLHVAKVTGFVEAVEERAAGAGASRYASRRSRSSTPPRGRPGSG